MGVKAIYRSKSLARTLESLLKARLSVQGAHANIYTASILIHYEPTRTAPSEIIGWVRQWSRQLPATQEEETETPLTRRRFSLPRRRQVEHPWHALSSARVLRLKKTSAETGLSSMEARKRLGRFGPNRIPVSPARTSWEIFSGQLKNLPTMLLTGAAGLSLVSGGGADAAMIIIVVLVNAVVGYRTESAAEEIVSVLSEVKHPKASVLRERKFRDVAVENIVIGDILCLLPGTHVPADARLIRSNLLSADESLLTGESLPATKSHLTLVDHANGKGVSLGDRRNMVYCGTTVTGGNGLAVVVATGSDTQIGKVQALIGASARPPASLHGRLEVLSKKLAIVSLLFSGAVMFAELLRGRRLIGSLKSAITLAVAAIPESLPTVATTILAQGVKRLRDSGVLIRRIESIEDLGAINLICLDKTGTLTRNEMTVTSVQTVGREFGQVAQVLRELPEALQLLRVAVLCNEVGDEAKEARGSSTEKALIRMAVSAGLRLDEIRGEFPLIGMHHRSEKRGFMSSTHRLGRGRSFIAVKGSPREVLLRCRSYMKDGKVIPLDAKTTKSIFRQNEKMTAEALRVLGFAFKEMRAKVPARAGRSLESKLIWLGLVGMSDPPRAEVPGFLRELRNAGIRPVMVTGDQGSTALAIGRNLRLAEGRVPEVLESTMLEKMNPEVFSASARRADIFARVSPAHKLRIVQALQKQGNRVAMTGDGINDGPALKTAHVGIAMGDGGTDVARRVADVVLMKDDLLAILTAIKEGRLVQVNMKKSMDYIVAQNLAEVLLIFLSVASGFGEPLNPLQLLWVNLITDIFPELALAQELPERDILRQPPGAALAPLLPTQDIRKIVSDGAILTSASLGGYLYGLKRYGRGPQARTLAFLSINTVSLLYAITARSKKFTIFDRHGLKSNPYIPAALGVGFSAEYLGAFFPALRGVLGTERVRPVDILVIVLGATFPILGIEFMKFVTSRIELEPSETLIGDFPPTVKAA